MRVLAFSDLHGGKEAYRNLVAKARKFKPDFVFCLGDFTVFEQGIENELRKISLLCKSVLVVHGNHETEGNVSRICRKFRSLSFVHKKIVSIGDYTVVSHGGGGFYGQGKLR